MSLKNQANFYLVLNVAPQASDKEIKKAYLRLAKIYHPDKNHGNRLAKKKFQQINSAWQVLKDPRKRQQFDESLKRAKQQAKRSVSKPPPSPPAPAKEKPIDLEAPLRISFEDLCQSRPKTIHYFKPINGKKIQSSFSVKVPWGARQNSRLRFKGKGGAEGKKVFGDLYIRIQIKPHKIFKLERGSKNLIIEYPISFVSAIKSQTLEIPSPYGLTTVSLQPPLKHKQLLKIKGHGLPENSKGDKGDLFVQILIDYPLKDSVKIKKQIEGMPFSRQRIYVEKFRKAGFIYPKVLKFQKKMQEIKRK